MSIADHSESPRVRNSLHALTKDVNDAGIQNADELIVVWHDAMRETLKRRTPRGGGMTSAQEDFLIRSGAFTRKSLNQAHEEVASGALLRRVTMTQAATLGDSLSREEVATLLGIGTSRVTHRQSDGLLFSFPIGRARRFPSWQFADSQPNCLLPELRAIIEAIPESMHPGSLAGFMTTPKATLVVEGDAKSPRHWLLGGGNADVVVALLESATRW